MVRRFLLPLSVTVGALTGVGVGLRLVAYHVPGPLLVACATAFTSSVALVVNFFAERLTTTVHRCTTPGCAFQVDVQGVSAGESARWREVAAAHPRHDLNR